MSYLRISDQVAAALRQGQPVVGLETSVLAHGLPHPENLSTVHEMMAAVEDAGAVPASVGVVAGEVVVGLTRDELERFSHDPNVAKASERDLGVLVGLGRDGATTVAATVAMAAMAGISVVATGGIGGVHRGGEASFDVSADLKALARHRVAVVCSGAKSILDLALTNEVLETEGVPVVGFGTRWLPGFHLAQTDIALEHSVDSVKQAADVIRAHFALAPGGIVLANPVPVLAAIASERLRDWVEEAEREAMRQGIVGKAQTPFLLGQIAAASGGRTLRANTALLVNNAVLAGQLATMLALGR
ncbi:MAG: pseudouridine-5'-phosphate glycosidase [Gammaproteobacteria bacterium]|jgi:pseudouridine-5'-phosphate glycosidase